MANEIQPYNDLDNSPSPTTTPTTPPPPSPPHDDLDTNFAVALGAIICILLALILWFMQVKLKRRHQLQALSADIERRSSSTYTSTTTTTSTLSRFSHSTLGKNSLSTTGIKHSDNNSRSEGRWGLLDQNIARLEEKRWWGSVAACGDAKKADQIVGSIGPEQQQQQGTQIVMKLVDGRTLCPHRENGWVHVDWRKGKSRADDGSLASVQEAEPAVTKERAWGSNTATRPWGSNGAESQWGSNRYRTNGVDRRDWVGTLRSN
jgi:hypothetical protein